MLNSWKLTAQDPSSRGWKISKLLGPAVSYGFYVFY